MKLSKFITLFFQNNTGSSLHFKIGVTFALVAVKKNGSVRLHCAQSLRDLLLLFTVRTVTFS